jgi:multidrug efflux system membrane fusion protein
MSPLFRFYPIALLIFAAMGLFPACNRNKAPAGAGKKAPVPVVIGEVARKDMPILVHAIGRVTSPASVSVKSQVTGNISEVHFKDGQTVKKGSLLCTIDQRPFEVLLEQARASYAEAVVKADNSQAQADRYSALGKVGSVSKEQAADFVATAKSAHALVQVAAAVVKSAELQLDYCSIRAPIDGRAGKALVTAGNVMTANQTDLVVINQIAPVEVTFAVAEQHLPAVQRGMAQGHPKVVALTSGVEGQSVEGELVFVDNNVKASTGTIELKAAFKNDRQVLWPGQFVNLELEVGVDRQGLVVPSAAVQQGQESAFIFVVKPDKTAGMRKVTVVRTVGEEALIGGGIESGAQVVIDGQSRLTLGAPVEIVPKENAPMGAAQPAAASAGLPATSGQRPQAKP